MQEEVGLSHRGVTTYSLYMQMSRPLLEFSAVGEQVKPYPVTT